MPRRPIPPSDDESEVSDIPSDIGWDPADVENTDGSGVQRPTTPPFTDFTPTARIKLDDLQKADLKKIEAQMYFSYSFINLLLILFSSMRDLEIGTDMEHKYMRYFTLFDELSIPFRDGYSLLPWQRLGVVFLLYCAGTYGFALLGDEMGVGKVPRSILKCSLMVRLSKHWPPFI